MIGGEYIQLNEFSASNLQIHEQWTRSLPDSSHELHEIGYEWNRRINRMLHYDKASESFTPLQSIIGKICLQHLMTLPGEK